MFGLPQAIAGLSHSGPDAPVARLVSGLEKAVADFVGDADQSDDITVLALSYLGESVEPGPLG